MKYFLFGSVFINLLLLDLAFLKVFPFTQQSSVTKQIVNVKPSSIPSANVCPISCMDAIKVATNSPNRAVTTKTVTLTNTTPKESFITFGSGNNSSSDWEDVPGVQAYIDTANYSGIKSVIFEASIHIPTGNQTADVRLFNATDKHPVWYSEMHYNGGSTAQLLTSQSVTLDPGNKLYKVQMKTQLKYPATLNSSRLRLVTY